MLDETFGTPTMTAVKLSPAEKIRLLRWLALAVALLTAVLGLLLLWWHSPVWKTWLFDLSIATVFAASAHLIGRRAIALEAVSKKRVAAAIVIGVTSAGAALGPFALTLVGQPAGLRQLPALVVVQLLGVLLGGAIGFGTGMLATAVVRGTSQFFACSNPPLDGAVIGALSGTLGAIPCLDFPHLGWWFLVVSAGWCSYCGSQAASHFTVSCTDVVAPSKVAN